jgi:predicted Zn-dependent protease
VQNSFGDVINLGAGASLTAIGGGADTINASANNFLDVSTTPVESSYIPPNIDTLNVSDDQNITLGNDTAADVEGSGNTITLDGQDSLTASGDTINALSAPGTNDEITGAGDAITASNDNLTIINLDGASDVVTGDNNTIFSDYSTIGLNGSDETVWGDSDAITLGAGEDISIGGTGDTITASGDQITFNADDSNIVVNGNEDTFISSGVNDQITDDRADGTSVLYDWDGSGEETDTVYSGADGSGEIIGGYGYTGDGPGSDLPGSYGGGYGAGDDGGGYGFVGHTFVTTTVGANIGSIAQYDRNHGNLSAAAAAETALQQAESVAAFAQTSGSGSAVFEGAKFDQQVITWSLADSQGTQAAPFSGYMDSADEAIVQNAFNTWSAAMPGVTFEEVSDSAQSDIRLGFGDFNTASTGVAGYTSYQSTKGEMAPGAIVRVEDPTENALMTGADGQQTYAGTDATLSQVLLHEIGHALGLADNTDQSSVMNYQLTASNKTLNNTDLTGIGSLYGGGASTVSVGSSGVSQLIQAMSTFNADAGVADTALLPAALSTNSITLAASAHAA